MPPKASRAQECRWNYANTISSSIRLRPRRDYNRVQQIVADLLFQPVQMPHVIVVHMCAQLYLDGDNSPRISRNHQVDFLAAGVCAKMMHGGFRCLRIDADVKRYESLEQPAQQCALTRRQC